MPEAIRKFTEISRDEWIAYQWLDVSVIGSDYERRYVRGLDRDPVDASQAAKDYDCLFIARQTLDFIKRFDRGIYA